MRKQVIKKPEEGMVIVILSNESLDILAKGISKCHAEDTFDEALGEKIANTRAWLKYYEKLEKSADRSLAWETDMLDFYTEEVARLKSMKELAISKRNEINAEYEEMIKGL